MLIVFIDYPALPTGWASWPTISTGCPARTSSTRWPSTRLRILRSSCGPWDTEAGAFSGKTEDADRCRAE